MIHTKKILVLIGALLILGLSAAAQQNRGVTVESVDQLPTGKKRWALVVGVNNYGLKGAANDAKALKDTLVKYAGFPEDQVLLLSTDASREDLLPTRKNIILALDKLARNVDKDGLFLFAFSGHGKTIDNNAYLIPSDGQMTNDRELLGELSINVGSIKKAVERMKIKQVLMILDACRDKIVVDGVKGSTSEPLTGAYNRGFSFDVANKEVEAFVTLYATKEGDFAYEYFDKETNQWRGFFSRAIEEGLAGKAAAANGAVTLGRLVEYLERNVPDRVYKEEGKRQFPWRSGNGFKESELVLAITANRAPAVPQTVRTPQTEIPQILPPVRGKKSNRVLYTFSATSGNKISPSDIFSIDSGLSELVISKLKEQSLTVLRYNDTDLTKDESSQYMGGINSRADEKALRLLPVALIISLNIDLLEDMPQTQELYIAKANGYIEIIDTDNNKTVKIERFDAVRGFGNSQEQARKNALRSVAENISDSFLNTVKEKAR